jgi:transcriptional regulator with XRE-family HTH domain
MILWILNNNLKNKIMAVKNIYVNIKECREQKNHSTDYVAIQMEMSVKMYLKIEMGSVDLKLSKLDKLVKILGVKKSEICKLEY